MRVQCRNCGLIFLISSGDVLVTKEWIKQKCCQFCGSTNKVELNEKEIEKTIPKGD